MSSSLLRCFSPVAASSSIRAFSSKPAAAATSASLKAKKTPTKAVGKNEEIDAVKTRAGMIFTLSRIQTALEEKKPIRMQVGLI